MLPPRVLAQGVLQCGAARVRVCAAGVGCVRSRRTACRALATVLSDDMLFSNRFCPVWTDFILAVCRPHTVRLGLAAGRDERWGVVKGTRKPHSTMVCLLYHVYANFLNDGRYGAMPYALLCAPPTGARYCSELKRVVVFQFVAVVVSARRTHRSSNQASALQSACRLTSGFSVTLTPPPGAVSVHESSSPLRR